MNRALLLLGAGDMAAAALAYHLVPAPPFSSAAEGVDAAMLRMMGLGLFVGMLMLTGYLSELYSWDRHYGRREIFLRISASLILAFFLLSGIYFLIPTMTPDRTTLVLSLGLFGLMQLTWHVVYLIVLRMPGVAQKVLIYGAGPLAEQIEKILATNPHNYILAGSVRPSAGSTVGAAAVNTLGCVDSLDVTATREKVHKIIISVSERRGVLPVREILGCKLNGIEIVDALSFYEQITGKLLVEKMHPSWFIFSNGSRVTPFMRIYKRFFDLLFASIGLALVSPLLPVIALAIRLDSPGPVLFRQVRVGKNERNFVLLKFRTMCTDAEKKTGAVWAVENDPRVTRVGKFLRKTRLDEIPQLINVLRGDMSFVGPRPERPEFVSTLKEKIPYYSHRHYVKPGATGWAQVKYPYGASVQDAEEKLCYDLYYIKNFSLTLDFIIILETVKVVLFGRGAR